MSERIKQSEENIEKEKIEWGETAPTSMSWVEIVDWCKSKGEGWRMPSSVELKNALENKVSGFKNDTFYWTSYYANTSSKFGYDSEGKVIGDYESKDKQNSVRCVRDLAI